MCLTESGRIECKGIVLKLRQIDGVILVIFYTMAALYQVGPPEPFTFSRPEEWTRWSRRFERFRQASGLKEKGDEAQA